jgi:hypothetical protein
MDSSNRYAQHYHTVKAQRPEFLLIDKHVPKLARTLLQGLKRRAEQAQNAEMTAARSRSELP